MLQCNFVSSTDFFTRNGSGRKFDEISRYRLGPVKTPWSEPGMNLHDAKLAIQVDQIYREAHEKHVHAVTSRSSKFEKQGLPARETPSEHQPPEFPPERVSQFHIARKHNAGRLVYQPQPTTDTLSAKMF